MLLHILESKTRTTNTYKFKEQIAKAKKERIETNTIFNA